MHPFRSLRLLVCVGVLAAGAATGASKSSASAAPRIPATVQHRHAPIIGKHRRADGTDTSGNWSGYALTGPNGSVTYVSGSWQVPTVKCTASTTYSSFWVGIDGYNSNTVEQTGTDSDCVNGQPTYYAWYEFYPRNSYNIATLDPISAGDVITASVSYLSGAFTVSITDATAVNPATGLPGITFSKTVATKVDQSSAEWIAESPSGVGGISNLAPFTPVTFTDAVATMANQGPHPIGWFFETGVTQAAGSSVVQQITMVQKSGAEAIPTGLTSSDGTGLVADNDTFTVSYKAAPPSKTKHGGQ